MFIFRLCWIFAALLGKPSVVASRGLLVVAGADPLGVASLAAERRPEGAWASVFVAVGVVAWRQRELRVRSSWIRDQT